MKKSDINGLKRAVLHLKQAEQNLDKVCESLWNRDAEFFRFIDGREKTTCTLVWEMLHDVTQERLYIEGKIKVFEEL